MNRSEFTKYTKQGGLSRQRFKCGSCGERITTLQQIGKQSHRFGEGAHAHHMKPCQHGGTNMLSNCVILCESCHYSVHAGGNYKNRAFYLISSATDYKYFNG